MNEVTELGRMLGLPLDERDRAKLRQIFDCTAEGPAEREVWVTGSQQRVRRTLIAASLGWLLLTQERRTLWSSPSWAEAADEYDQVSGLLRDPANHRSGAIHQIRRMRAGNGAQEIESHFGTRLLFRGRAGSGHRGLMVSRLILEGYADARVLGEYIPCLAGQKTSQLVRTVADEDEPAQPEKVAAFA